MVQKKTAEMADSCLSEAGLTHVEFNWFCGVPTSRIISQLFAAISQFIRIIL
jgi:hypothetical protein